MKLFVHTLHLRVPGTLFYFSERAPGHMLRRTRLGRAIVFRLNNTRFISWSYLLLLLPNARQEGQLLCRRLVGLRLVHQTHVRHGARQPVRLQLL